MTATSIAPRSASMPQAPQNRLPWEPPSLLDALAIDAAPFVQLPAIPSHTSPSPRPTPKTTRRGAAAIAKPRSSRRQQLVAPPARPQPAPGNKARPVPPSSQDSQRQASQGKAWPAPAAPVPGGSGLGTTEAQAPTSVDPVVLNSPTPQYPFSARRLGIEGRVVLRVQVSERGLADEVSVKKGSGSHLLDQAAMTALRRWRFVPARQNGRTVAKWVEVSVYFRLKNQAPSYVLGDDGACGSGDCRD